MKSSARTIGGYGLATIFQAAVAFATVPVLLRAMQPQDFAMWVLLEPVIALVANVSLLGAQHGMLYQIADGRKSTLETLAQFCRFGVMHLLPITVCAVIAYSAYAEISADVCFGVAILVLFEACLITLQFVSRSTGDASLYVIQVGTRGGLIALGLGIIFAMKLQVSLAQYVGFVTAISGATLLVAGCCHCRGRAPVYRANIRHRKDYFEAIRYGFPILVTSSITIVAINADRYIVDSALATDDLVRYIVYVKLAGLLSLAMTPVNLWWPVARLRNVARKEEGKEFFANAEVVLLAYYSSVAVSVYAWLPLILSIYAPTVLVGEHLALVVLLVSGVCQAMTVPVNIGLLQTGRTHWLTIITLLATILGIAVGILLAPKFGLTGAALGTLLSSFAGMSAIALTSSRLYPIERHWVRTLTLLVIGLTGLLCLALLSSAVLRIAASLALAALSFLIAQKSLVSITRPSSLQA